MARRPVEFRDLPAAREVDLTAPDTGFWHAVAQSYDTGWIGAVTHQVRQSMMPGQDGYDGLANIPAGYEQYADRFALAQSQQAVDFIKTNIDDAVDARQMREVRGGWTTFGADMFAGFIDPINMLPLPALKGIGMMRGAIAGGVSIGALSAGTEVIRGVGDPTVTRDEQMFGIGAGILFGAAFGSAFGNYGAKAASRGARVGVGATDGAAPPAARPAGGAGSMTSADRRALINGTVDPLDNVRPLEREAADVSDETLASELSAATAMREAALPDERIQWQAYIVDLNDEIAERAAARAGNETPPPARLADDPATVPPPSRAEAAAAREEAAAAKRDAEAAKAAEDYFSAHAAAEGLHSPDSIDVSGRQLAVEYGSTNDGAVVALRVGDDGTRSLLVNDAAIINEFDTGAWRNPDVPGATPLAEGAITDAAELLQYRVIQALTADTLPRLEGETTAAFADRVNELAMAETKAQRSPFSPAGGTLAKLAIRPTPLGQMQALTKTTEAHDALMGVAGDMQVLTEANLAGRATTPGGSAWQRAARWLVANVETQAHSDAAYVKYLKGASKGSRFGDQIEVLRATIPFVGARSQGKLTPKQWREMVGEAVFDDEPFSLHGHAVPPEAREAAEVYRRHFQKFETEMRSLGMFDRQRQAQREVNWREETLAYESKTLDDMNARAHTLSTRAENYRLDLEERVPRMTRELQSWRAELEAAAAQPVRIKGETNYFHRIWDKGAVRERRADLHKLLTERFALDRSEGAAERADKAIDNILGEVLDDVDDPMARKGFGESAGPFDSRDIPLTNKEVRDFIVKDAELVMGVYSRRTSAAIEVVRKFGSRDMAEHIDGVKRGMMRDGHSRDEIKAAVQLVADARDRVLGRFHAKDPMSWDNRAARFMKSTINMSLLGKMVFSQMAETGRSIGTVGPKPIYQALMARFAGTHGHLANGPLAAVGGEALEMVTARYMANMMDEGTAMMVTQSTWIERFMASATVPFFTINGNNPLTVIMKETIALASSAILIDESAALARAVRAGGVGDEAVIARLASFGISKRDAMMIADMPWEKEGQNLTMPNLDAWAELPDGAYARDVLLGAINGEIRRSVVTPGPLDRPRIMDGVFMWNGERKEWPLLGMPAQLMSFSLASGSRLAHSALTGRERQTAMGLMAVLTTGYLGARLSADGWDKLSWDKQAMATWNKSGISTWLGDVVGRAQQLANLQVSDILQAEGSRPEADLMSDRAGAIAPVLSVWGGVIEAFTNPDLDDYQQARLIRRAVPWAGMLWWSSALKEVTSPERGGRNQPMQGGMAAAGEDAMEMPSLDLPPPPKPPAPAPVPVAAPPPRPVPEPPPPPPPARSAPPPPAPKAPARAAVATQRVAAAIQPAERRALAEHFDAQDSQVSDMFGQLADAVVAHVTGIGSAGAGMFRDVAASVSGRVLQTTAVFNTNGLKRAGSDVMARIERAFEPDPPPSLVMEPQARAAMSSTAAMIFDTVGYAAVAGGKGFVIADKPNGQVHVFDNTGHHLGSSAALYGRDAGDTMTSAQQRKPLADLVDGDRITPAGAFKMRFSKQPSVYPGNAAMFLVDKDNRDVGAVAVHGVYKLHAAENRLGRMASAGADDNKVSSGCINIDDKLFIEKLLPNAAQFVGGTVFVLPDRVENTRAMFTGR